MSRTSLENRLKDQARHLGFDLVGITAPVPSGHMEPYREWVGAGMHGEMGYLARPDAVERRGDLRRTLEGVRSVIVVAHGYGQDDPPGVPEDRSRGIIARYARGRDYHKVVKKRLLELVRWLDAQAPGGAHRVYVDTGPVLERELAQRAGLGWFGRNTMLINPGRGSYLFLGAVLTTVALETDPPFEADRCGSCTACLDACPTGALLGRNEDGAPVLDARLCISYLTIEHRGEIPEELRGRMGNRVYGCDICQEVCPWNGRFGARGTEPAYAARAPEAGRPGTDGPSLVELMRMTGEEWDLWTRGSAIRRAGFGGLRRNVAIALGNWLSAKDAPDPEAVGELAAALPDEDPVVAEAAAWALGRLGEMT